MNKKEKIIKWVFILNIIIFPALAGLTYVWGTVTEFVIMFAIMIISSVISTFLLKGRSVT